MSRKTASGTSSGMTSTTRCVLWGVWLLHGTLLEVPTGSAILVMSSLAVLTYLVLVPTIDPPSLSSHCLMLLRANGLTGAIGPSRGMTHTLRAGATPTPVSVAAG